MTLQKISFEYNIPDGYRFVAYRRAEHGESYLRFGQIVIADSNNGSEWPIIEKITEQSEPSKRHKHADLIHAWAEGAEIEYQRSNGTWEDCEPAWAENTNYRIKPKTKTVRFRNFIHTLGFVSSTGCDLSDKDYFKKWIGDWQEVEIEE